MIGERDRFLIREALLNDLIKDTDEIVRKERDGEDTKLDKKEWDYKYKAYHNLIIGQFKMTIPQRFSPFETKEAK